jgi:flavodoxin
MKSFLAGYNLSGKYIAPFCTHGGSGTAQSVNDIRSVCSNSTILSSLVVYGSRAESFRADVERWLEQIGIIKNN